MMSPFHKSILSRAFLNLAALFAATLGALPSITHAVDLNISAEFRPSLLNPTHNKFTNTTPQSGYCGRWPKFCQNGQFSINLPLDVVFENLDAGVRNRNSAYFGTPSSFRPVRVLHQDGTTEAQLQWRVNLISMRRSSNDPAAWTPTWVNAPSPCRYAGVGIISGNDYDAAWIVPLDVGGCFRNPIRPISGPIIISRLSIGYELVTPDPLAMKNGVYTGDLMLSVGPHADFDFGDRATVSDTEVHVRFTLTVVHDFKITRPDAVAPVILQPKGGWEHGHGRVPGGLQGELPVLISSSAPFGITLQCEHRSGDQCGIQSENDGSNVPVVTSITAPGLQHVETKIAAYRHALSPLHREAFETSHGYVADRPSRIHFNVPGESTEIMLKQPGSRWRGDITLIFDSQL